MGHAQFGPKTGCKETWIENRNLLSRWMKGQRWWKFTASWIFPRDTGMLGREAALPECEKRCVSRPSNSLFSSTSLYQKQYLGDYKLKWWSHRNSALYHVTLHKENRRLPLCVCPAYLLCVRYCTKYTTDIVSFNLPWVWLSLSYWGGPRGSEGISNLRRSTQLVSSLRRGLCHFHPLERNTILRTL